MLISPTSKGEQVIDLIQRAKRQERDREVTYVWQSQDLNIQRMGETDLWGEQIELEFSHNAKRKKYEATIRRVVWQPSAGFTVTSFEVFSADYPARVIYDRQVGRYSDKSFSEFERYVIDNIDAWVESTELVRDLLTRTLAY